MPEYSVETCLHWCDFVSYLWVPSNAYLLGQNVEVRKATLSIHRHDYIHSIFLALFSKCFRIHKDSSTAIKELKLKNSLWAALFETKCPFCFFDCVFSRLLYMVFSPYSSYRNSQSFDWIWKNTFHTRCIHTLVCICYFANS